MFGFKNKKTVDGVLSAFHAAISDLQALAEQHQVHAEEQAKIAEKVLLEKAAHEAEAERATTIARQMKAIFN